jgi:phosphoglucosamine mutase
MGDAKRNIFGTDGIRGEANTYPLDPETVVRLGKAIAKVFSKAQRKHRILIGKDTRLSGYMLETSLAAGITSMGVDVLYTGPIPTPGVSYLTKSMRADAGVMISASHNPFEDNGIKIFSADGGKLPDDAELELERLMGHGVLDKEHAEAGEIGKAFRIDDALGRYTVFLKECFPREVGLDGIKIGFDGANGAGYVVGPQTFQELGAEVTSRGVSPNGKNINAGFGSLYPDVVRRLVLEQNLDIGVSLDGDADRAILVDEKGGIVDGDVLMAICAADLKRRGKLKDDTVVSTVMSNLGLERYLKGLNIKLIRTAVGDRYVQEAMIKGAYSLGGEQSGHVIFAKHALSGDGILTALMVLSIMARERLSLSELASGFVRFPQKIINIPVAHKPPLESLIETQKLIKKSEEALSNEGRILVRYSGTENKARVMVECESDSRCNQIASDIATSIEREVKAIS